MNFKTKPIIAAIFDMDGTMFDTERLRLKMLNRASQEIYNENIRNEILIDSLGLSAAAAEDLAKKQYGDHYPYKEIRQKADELEMEFVRKNGVPVKEGLLDVLERLKKNGILLAVATSSKRDITEEYLLNADIMLYFDIIVCGDEVTKGKPDPEIFLKAANELNCHVSNCLIFEDSENGLLAASKSGAVPIFIKDIKEPKPEIKQLAFESYDNMPEFLDDLVKFTTKMPVPHLNEPFPKKFNHMKVGIHGFGAIGGGYLTQIFSHWDGYTRPAEITGATRDMILRKLINDFGKFNVHYESLAFDQTIHNVHIIDIADETKMKKMYAESDIIGLSLPESTIKQQSEIIAKGLLERDKLNGSNLTILVILNKINGGMYVKRHVKKAIMKLAGEDKSNEIISKTYFCETVVNRIVSKTPNRLLLRQVQMNLRNFETNIDNTEFKNIFIEPIDQHKPTRKKAKTISQSLKCCLQLIKGFSDINITLFNSGPFMPLYATKGSPILERLRQVKIIDDIKQMQELKNKLSNGTHAILAWYSSLLGYKTIGQGMGDERIITLVKNVMKNEIKPTMLKIYPDLSGYIDNFIADFIKRCRYSFKDPCSRVGRDPLRKLQRHERILGTIDLAHRNNIRTPLLEFGIAAGLLYAISFDNPNDRECEIIKKLYTDNKSIRSILTFKGNYNGNPYQCLDEEKDIGLIKRIEENFDELINIFPIKQAIVLQLS